MFNEEQKLKGMEKKDYSSEIYDCCYKIKEKLDNDNSLSLFEKRSVTTMFMQVMNALSNNDKAKALCKEVEKIMVGKILDYEARDIRNEGIAIGLKKGINQGINQGISQGINQITDQMKNSIFEYIKNNEFEYAYIIEKLNPNIPEKDKDLSFMRTVMAVHGINTTPFADALKAIANVKGKDANFILNLQKEVMNTTEYKQLLHKDAPISKQKAYS